jgi:hypothetical protein
MKKYKFLLSSLIAFLLLSACIDDKGNYSYLDLDEINPAKVSNFGSDYTYIAYIADTLKINPKLSEGANTTDYDYLWYIYSPNLKADTIGNEQNLSYVVAVTTGTDYKITLRITNKLSGVFKYYTSTLKVISPFDQGWYITKDINGVADIDLIASDSLIFRDILKTVNGEGVPGEGITCADTRYISVSVPLENGRDTILKNHDCLYLMTRSTIQLYDIENMKLLNKFEDLFMDVPVAAPQDISSTKDFKVIVNNGLPYVLDTRTSAANIGKWGVASAGAEIDPTNMLRSSLGCFLMFDKQTSPLKMLNTLNGSFGTLVNAGNYPCNNMDFDMVFMREKVQMMQGGVAIMKKKSSNDYYGLTISGFNGGGYWEMPGMPSMSYTNPILTCVQIPANSNVTAAKVYGTHKNMNMLYFSQGDNEVWCYNLTSPKEDKIATFAADEKVTYVNTVVKYLPSGEVWNLAVLTSQGGNWNFYLYEFQPSSQLVKPEPTAVYSGEGIPRHVHYRSLSSTTSF